jgi:hypothetical protein
MKNLIALLFAVILLVSCESRSARTIRAQQQETPLRRVDAITFVKGQFPGSVVYEGNKSNEFIVVNRTEESVYYVTVQWPNNKVSIAGFTSKGKY